MSKNRRLINLEKKHQTMPAGLSLEQFRSLSLEQMARHLKPFYADATPRKRNGCIGN